MDYPTFIVTLAGKDGAPDEVFEVYIDLMLNEEDALLRWTGLTWSEWLPAIDEGKPDALRFLYWLGRERSDNPITGKFSEINFWRGQLTWELKESQVETTDEPDPSEGVVTESA